MQITSHINWPERNGGYKVIQLYLDGNPDLAFFNGRFYHSVGLDIFLRGRGIEPETSRDRDGAFAPVLEGERYRVCGAGEVFIFSKRAVFGGRSIGYGVRIDREHLEKIAELEPDWMISEG